MNLQQIFVKRIISKMIDIFIPTLIGSISYLIVYYQRPNSLFLKTVSLPTFIWFFYLLITFTAILRTKGMTLGDIFLKIQIVSFNNTEVSIYKVLLREIYISLLLISLFKISGSWVAFILSFIPIKYQDNLIYLMDMAYKTKYISKQ